MRHTYPYTDLLARFAEEVTEHQMTVLHDDGLYRHVRFQKPTNSWHYRFDLITWPGVLVIDGDMGSYMFARTTDMFDFFNGATINPSYWGEKLRAKSDYREFSEDVLKARVAEYVNDYIDLNDLSDKDAEALRFAVTDEVLDVAYDNTLAHQALSNFEYEGFEFVDTWEWDLTDFTVQYLWSCAAIRWGIAQYKEGRR